VTQGDPARQPQTGLQENGRATERREGRRSLSLSLSFSLYFSLFLVLCSSSSFELSCLCWRLIDAGNDDSAAQDASDAHLGEGDDDDDDDDEKRKKERTKKSNRGRRRREKREQQNRTKWKEGRKEAEPEPPFASALPETRKKERNK
jgi:hypothetical protein